MRIEQLQYIAEVARCQSLSKASQRLHISQPCLSTAITNLEKEMGCKLFHRTPKGTVPTIIGEEVLSIAQSILADFDRLNNFTQQQSLKNDIHIAASPAICNSAIQDISLVINDHLPQMSLYIHEVRSEEIIERLRDRIFSACIISLIDHFQSFSEDEYFRFNYQSKLLYTDKMVIFAAQDSPLQQAQNLTVADVLEYYHTASQITNRMLLSQYTHHPTLNSLLNNCDYNFTDRENIKQLISRGEAVAALPYSYMDIRHRNGTFIESSIQPLPVTDFDIPMTFYLLYPTGQLSLYEKICIQLILDYFEQKYPHKQAYPNE